MKKSIKLIYLALFCALLPPISFASTQPENLAVSNPWYYRAFGQSTDTFFNNVSNGKGQNGINNVWINPTFLADSDSNTFVQTEANLKTALPPNTPIKLLASDIILLDSRGGKIANSHDGETFFYTVLPADQNYVMTAKVTKNMFGVNPSNAHNNTKTNAQSGGGMQARDTVGTNRAIPPIVGFEELPAISNFAAVGFRGVDTVGAMYRDGATSLTKGVGVNKPVVDYDPAVIQRVGQTFTYKLERKDDAFYATVLSEDGKKVRYPEKRDGNADLVTRIDKDHIYFGFFGARELRMTISDVQIYATGKAKTVQTEAPVVIAKPFVVVKSSHKTDRADYTMTTVVNYDGLLKVTDSHSLVLYDGKVNAFRELYIKSQLEKGDNQFNFLYTPNKLNPIPYTHTVNFTESATSNVKNIYVSTTGTGDGTLNNPMEIHHAVDIATPGQTILLADGTYPGINIKIENSGLPNQPITLMPINRGKVNFSDSIDIAGDYWSIKDLLIGGKDADHKIEKSPINIVGNFNTIENCIVEYSFSTGLNIGGNNGALASPVQKASWPKYNVVINSESRFNVDAAGNNADGFGAKRVDEGNLFYGSIAHHNVDDGFDFFTRVDTGPSGRIYVDHSIAHDNIHNGFKAGGESQPSNHIFKDSISFKNGMAGISDNFNPGYLQFLNMTSVDNHDQNIMLRKNTLIKPANVVINSVSFRNDESYGLDDSISGKVINSATVSKGVSTLDHYTVTPADFITTTPPTRYQRDSNNEIVWGDFMRVSATSQLNKMGVGTLDTKNSTAYLFSKALTPLEMTPVRIALAMGLVLDKSQLLNEPNAAITVGEFAKTIALNSNLSSGSADYLASLNANNDPLTRVQMVVILDTILQHEQKPVVNNRLDLSKQWTDFSQLDASTQNRVENLYNNHLILPMDEPMFAPEQRVTRFQAITESIAINKLVSKS